MTTATEPPFVVKCPEDLIAFVPVALGFEPRDSVVLLTFGGGRPFHARLDLPPPNGVDRCVAQLLRPARRHRVDRAALLIYTDDHRRARRVGRAARQAFQTARITLIDVLRVDAGCWFAPLGGGAVDQGVPYDVSAHPFRARAVLLGKVTLGSREELVASLAPDVAGGARVAAATAEVEPLDAGAVERLVTGWLELRSTPDDREVAALLLGLTDDQVMLAACGRMGAVRVAEADAARARVDFWRAVVRRAPGWLVAEPAAVLAFVAWLAGDGALAWCAVDRSRECDSHPLADLVAGLLEEAVPPEAWRGGLGAMPEDAAG